MENKYNQEMVNTLYPQCPALYDAMRIWSLPKGKEWMLQEKCECGEYFGQIKKDGYWYQYVNGESEGYLFSRNVSEATGLLTEKIANVPHIEKALSVMPKNTILIGEIYVPGKTSKGVTRIMGCLPDLAKKRQEEEGLVHYYIHDIISFNGILLLDKPAIKRVEVLKKVYETFNFDKYDFLELAEVYQDNLFERIGIALENGEEGMVLKKKDSLYSPGKKPAWSAIKCKKVDYADVVCMGFEDATKEYTGKELESWQYWEDSQGNKYNSYESAKDQEYSIQPITKPYYYGWKTSIIIGAYNEKSELKKIGTVSSGLTDEMKKIITKDPQSFIGKVLMVQCMEQDKEAKTFRHPIFKQFREDKNAEECTFEEVF